MTASSQEHRDDGLPSGHGSGIKPARVQSTHPKTQKPSPRLSLDLHGSAKPDAPGPANDNTDMHVSERYAGSRMHSSVSDRHIRTHPVPIRWFGCILPPPSHRSLRTLLFCCCCCCCCFRSWGEDGSRKQVASHQCGDRRASVTTPLKVVCHGWGLRRLGSEIALTGTSRGGEGEGIRLCAMRR